MIKRRETGGGTMVDTEPMTENRSVQREREREEIFCRALEQSVAPETAWITREVWDRLRGNIPGVLRVPYLDVREGGGVLLTWDQGAHHLDLEIAPAVPLDFFYLNRETGEAWDIESPLEERIPEKALQVFNRFRIIG